MKRCLTCHAVYDDEQEFCEKDGTSLLDTTSPTPIQQVLKGKAGINKGGVVAIAAGIFIAIFAFGIFYIFNRQAAPPTSGNMSAPSPDKAGEIREPSSDSALQPSKSNPSYFVIGLSSREQADAIQEMERRNQTGYQTHVTYSSDWSDLSPGYYVVVYGVFDTMTKATTAANELKSREVQVYVKYAGSLKSDGATPTLENETSQHNADPINAADPDQAAAVRQSGTVAEQAVSEVKKLWEQHFTRCGDSYVSLDSNNIVRQLRNVTFDVSDHHRLTKMDELNGFEWSGKVKAKWNVWRRGTRHNLNLVWGDWRESQQGFSFDVSKKDSKWKVLNAIYDQKKVECSDLP